MMMNLNFTAGRRNVTNAMADAAILASAGLREPEDKLSTFERDDLVAYSGHGIGRVERIEMQDVGGHALRVIQVSFPSKQLTLRIPAATAHSSGLRRLATREFIDKALAVIVGRQSFRKGNWTQRTRILEEKLSSGDVMRLAEVVRDLRHHAGNDKGSFGERRIFQAALEHLAAELALLMKWDESYASAHLLGLIKGVQESAISQDLSDVGSSEAEQIHI